MKTISSRNVVKNADTDVHFVKECVQNILYPGTGKDYD